MVGVGVNDVTIVGEPVAFGLGFFVLLFVLLTGELAHVLVTVAHEGGHVVMSVLTFRGHRGFELTDGGGGKTILVDTRWGPGDLLVRFVGYPAPSLLGLGGAAAIADGNAWGVLWAAVVLLLAAYFVAANPLALLVSTLAALGVGLVAVRGSAALQATVAVGLVWWMLLGGALWTIKASTAPKSDAGILSRRTLVPAVIWYLVWVAIALYALIVGAQLLLRPGYSL